MPVLHNLSNEMRKNKITIRQMSDEVNIPESTLKDKIAGRTNFTIEQAILIKTNYFNNLDYEYLFDKKSN